MNSGLAARERASRDLAHDLAVTAGAGAGKTTVLVDRFVAIARDPELGPDRVLALTFTRKAAVEMKERAIRVFEASHEADLRRRTEAAYISTIHGFAERVLRERPLDARIDPAFNVLTEYDQALFVEEALRAMYAREDLCSFTRRLGKRFGGGWKIFSLTREVARLMREGPEAAAREELLLGDGDDACVQRALERARAYVGERERRAVACLRHLLPVLDGARFKSQGKRYAQAQDYIASARACVECGSLDGALMVLGETRFTGEIIEDDRQHVKDLLGPVKETVKLMGGIEWSAQEYLERELLPLKRAIYGATREISDTYAAHKRQLGALDFHDLQLRARDLLSGNDRIRREYSDRFRHILLDEAQDTDELQYGIIRLFDDPGNTLFMVGDPKQAIYEFRGANPDVFKQAIERLPVDCRLQLPENFRSRPEVISFVNGIGPALLGSSFIHIQACADYDGQWLDAPAVTAIRAVQKIVSGEGERPRHEPVSDAREREAAAVAEEIARLLRERPLVRDPDSREVMWVPLQPRHIAVLFRTRTALPYFERAFAVRGIPYVTAAGQGFYERAEVLDCLMMLRALAQPLDDLAMAAVLRSPFVGASDADLWRLRRPPVGDDTPALYEALGDYAPLADFLGRFDALRRRSGALPAADALDGAIRDFGYEAALAAHEDGPAMLANLSKLRRQLRAMGAVSPAEAHRELARARDLMTTEATAPIVGPADDVAVLTTIHQAKGLEWPVVCLPNLQSAQQDHDGDFSARHGMLLCAALDQDGKEAKPLSVKAAAEELRARREAEERRLLYVALTRARERLILSACVKQGEDEPKYKGQYAAPLDFLMANTERTLIDEGEHDCGSYITSVRHITEPVASATQYEGGSSLAATIEPREIAAPPDDPPAPWSVALPLSVKVTELLSFGRCPQVYRFAHVLEIEEHTASRASSRDRGKARPSPVELGTIVHSLLERARFDAPDMSAEIDRLVEGQAEEQRSALALMLEPVLTGELGAAVRGAQRVEREWPFAFEAAGVLVEGVMDLALQGSDGRWTVVDYKSNDLKRAGRREQLIDYYTPQLELYALALSRSGLGDVAECALVFLTGPSVHRWPFDPAARNVDEWARSIIGRIAARDYSTSAGPKCERCGYLKRRVCDTGQSWSASRPGIAAPELDVVGGRDS